MDNNPLFSGPFINTGGRVVWLTGNSGAGKTTIAYGAKAQMRRDVVILDGDEMRRTISTDCGFSPEDRRRHNIRVASLARLLANQGFLVIVSVIAPFQSVRNELSPICQPTWVYVKRTLPEDKNKPYEPPFNPAAVLDHDVLSIEESVAQLISVCQKVAE